MFSEAIVIRECCENNQMELIEKLKHNNNHYSRLACFTCFLDITAKRHRNSTENTLILLDVDAEDRENKIRLETKGFRFID